MAKFDPGVTFTDGDTVTAASLNNIVDTLNIYSGLIADQTAIAGTVSTADLLLLADTDQGSSGAANKVTIQKLLNDALTNGTFTDANISEDLTYGTATGNRTVSTSAVITNGTITTGVIPTGTFGTTTSTAATITTGTIPTLTAGTTTGTAGIFTSGTIATLNSTTGTIATLNSTTGTVTNLSTTLAGDFTISQGTATLATSGATAGTYGSVTAIPFLTVNAKGIITAATSGTFSSIPADGSITPAKLSQPFTSATAVASTSGTAIDFTGIPSWVKRVTVMFNGVSTSGVSAIQIQLGSTSIQTSSYSGKATRFSTAPANVYTSSSSGFINSGSLSADSTRIGTFYISNISSNNWIIFGSFTTTNTDGDTTIINGAVSLLGTLDRLRITTVTGTETFDAGSINIMYEG